MGGRGRALTIFADRIKGSVRRRRQVAKPTVCKTVIHRFESGRRLQIPRVAILGLAGIFFGLGALLGPAGCSDPPPPPPVPGPTYLPRWSVAPYVAWTGPSAPVRLPLAVFIDSPGGPLDAIAANLDVTTFLNDRFHPWFLTPGAAPGLTEATPAALILDETGCVLVAPFLPDGPDAWIEAANQALREQREGKHPTGALPQITFSFPLPEDHPLRGRCAREHESR